MSALATPDILTQEPLQTNTVNLNAYLTFLATANKATGPDAPIVIPTLLDPQYVLNSEIAPGSAIERLIYVCELAVVKGLQDQIVPHDKANIVSATYLEPVSVVITKSNEKIILHSNTPDTYEKSAIEKINSEGIPSEMIPMTPEDATQVLCILLDTINSNIDLTSWQSQEFLRSIGRLFLLEAMSVNDPKAKEKYMKLARETANVISSDLPFKEITKTFSTEDYIQSIQEIYEIYLLQAIRNNHSNINDRDIFGFIDLYTTNTINFIKQILNQEERGVI